MPFRSEKIRLPETLDRRVKLTAAQKAEIRHRYLAGGCSLRGLAREYGVSHKTVLLIVNPESKAVNDRRIKEHWMDYKESREKHAAVVREHRRYKQDLLLSGKISINSTENGGNHDATQGKRPAP